MDIAERFGWRLSVPLFVLGLAVIVQSQNGSPNTTLNPLPPDVPSTTTPAILPPAPTSTVPTPSSPSVPSDTTCCYVQSNCNNCTETFKVNSIVYCCPNCVGMVLVTDLLCRCTVPKGYVAQNLKCKLTNTVVGDYLALRPSYYDAGSVVLRSSLFGVVAAGILTLVML